MGVGKEGVNRSRLSPPEPGPGRGEDESPFAQREKVEWPPWNSGIATVLAVRARRNLLNVAGPATFPADVIVFYVEHRVALGTSVFVTPVWPQSYPLSTFRAHEELACAVARFTSLRIEAVMALRSVVVFRRVFLVVSHPSTLIAEPDESPTCFTWVLEEDLPLSAACLTPMFPPPAGDATALAVQACDDFLNVASPATFPADVIVFYVEHRVAPGTRILLTPVLLVIHLVPAIWANEDRARSPTTLASTSAVRTVLAVVALYLLVIPFPATLVAQPHQSPACHPLGRDHPSWSDLLRSSWVICRSWH